MNIYIFFGQSGAGKSFLANQLQENNGFLHFDGDQILSPKMINFITQGKVFTQSMVDEYTELLKQKIRFFYETSNGTVIISQGLYRNKNRLEILKEFPNIQFFLITADAEKCYERIQGRTNGITVEYAQKISPLFEPPTGFDFIKIDNNKVFTE